MTAAPDLRSETFRANRSHGRVSVSMAAFGAATRRTSVNESGSFRVRFPNVTSDAAEAVLVNTAGGIAGGDRCDLEFDLAEGANLVVTTAAAEKVYRSGGDSAQASTKLRLAAGARLSWLPQETILFDGAEFSRSVEIDLAKGASLVFAEAVVFGRSARGEAVREGALHDRWRVRQDGRLVFADAVRLRGAVAEKLAQTAVANGGVALATLLIAPADEAQMSAIRNIEAEFTGEVGVSSWNGITLARFCARDSAALRHDVALALATLGCPLPRLWLN